MWNNSLAGSYIIRFLYVVDEWTVTWYFFFFIFFKILLTYSISPLCILSSPLAADGNRQAASPSLWCFLSHLHPQTTFISKSSSTTTATISSSGCPISSSSSTTQHHYHYHHHHHHQHNAGLKFSPSEALGRLRRGKEGVSLPLDRCCWLRFPSLCLAFSHITHLTDWLTFLCYWSCRVTALHFDLCVVF